MPTRWSGASSVSWSRSSPIVSKSGIRNSIQRVLVTTQSGRPSSRSSAPTWTHGTTNQQVCWSQTLLIRSFFGLKLIKHDTIDCSWLIFLWFQYASQELSSKCWTTSQINFCKCLKLTVWPTWSLEALLMPEQLGFASCHAAWSELYIRAYRHVWSMMLSENIGFLLVQRILFAHLLAFPRCLVAHAPSVEACTTLSCEVLKSHGNCSGV